MEHSMNLRGPRLRFPFSLLRIFERGRQKRLRRQRLRAPIVSSQIEILQSRRMLSAANVTIGDTSIVEGGDLVFDVSLSQPDAVDTVITYSTADGTATTADGDYTGQSAQTLTILAGQTSGTITVATTGDNTIELDETIIVNLLPGRLHDHRRSGPGHDPQ